ncbi:MAG: beta-ketoacyl-[acyl-carrier-protein] synthase family protein [Pseudomonadota bacterium]
MARRVVVTGLGVVCASGADAASFNAALSDGRTAIAEHVFTAGEGLETTAPGAKVEGVDEAVGALGRDLARADLFSQYAALAADQAVDDAGLSADEPLGDRTAVILGAGIGGHSAMEDAYVGILRKDRRPHPLTILKTIPNAAASQLSIRYGARGPAFAVSSACASGAHAIGLCANLIRSGAADRGLAGASEAVLTYGSILAWKAMHILSPDMCRPFSKERNGLVIGDGAGVLMLEAYEAAKARGAPIYAELAGFGMNADGADMINPAVDGAAGALALALEPAPSTSPDAVYVNAHGTGTLMNDPTETKAIRRVFGADADRLAVSSTKSMHGHLLGAAGAVEAVASLLAMKNGFAPPTANYQTPDPDCDLDVTPNEARPRRIDLALSNSFAFGGMNAVLAFSRV